MKRLDIMAIIIECPKMGCKRHVNTHACNVKSRKSHISRTKSLTFLLKLKRKNLHIRVRVNVSILLEVIQNMSCPLFKNVCYN